MDSGKRGIPQCHCARRQSHERRKARKECKRKRQTLVYNPEEETWHEIYMQDLRKEFSDVSILCTSKIELPWKDIALPTTGVKIRPDVALSDTNDTAEERLIADTEADLETKESNGAMILPWQDLIVTSTIESTQPMSTCDSSLEIPWNDLSIEKPMEITVQPEEDECEPDAVEIPWDVILMPRNIVIEPDEKRKHPSSKYPPRSISDAACLTCGIYPCCAKVRGAKM